MALQQNHNHESNMSRPRDLAAARKFFQRRRTGLDRKAKDLVMKEYTQHGVDVQVTIIYEFDAGAETYMFRSHLEGRGRWWPTLDALKAECGDRTTAMMELNKEGMDLLGWANYQQQQSAGSVVHPVTPKAIETKSELAEDILASTLPFDSNDTYGDGSGYDSSYNSSEDSQDEYSASEEEVCRSRRPKEPYKLSTRSQEHDTPHRNSPKRRREGKTAPMQWHVQNPPPQPVFQSSYGNTYGYTNAPITVAMATQQNGMYGALPQNTLSQSAPPVSVLPRSDISVSAQSPDLYHNFTTDLGMGQSFPDHMSHTSGPSRVLDVPQTKRTRKSKRNSEQRKRISSRRTTS